MNYIHFVSLHKKRLCKLNKTYIKNTVTVTHLVHSRSEIPGCIRSTAKCFQQKRAQVQRWGCLQSRSGTYREPCLPTWEERTAASHWWLSANSQLSGGVCGSHSLEEAVEIRVVAVCHGATLGEQRGHWRWWPLRISDWNSFSPLALYCDSLIAKSSPALAPLADSSSRDGSCLLHKDAWREKQCGGDGADTQIYTWSPGTL